MIQDEALEGGEEQVSKGEFKATNYMQHAQDISLFSQYIQS
jgi:hypothetical protein